MMTKTFRAPRWRFFFLAAFSVTAMIRANDADLIFTDGNTYTVNKKQPRAEAIAVMIEFYAAVARKGVKGQSVEGWYPEQAVSREDALKMFTIWPAYAAFEENDKGSIKASKLADFTVLSQDIMKIPEPEILKTRAELTVIRGEIVYQR
jgi:predicted amidohydrolase YtcJ